MAWLTQNSMILVPRFKSTELTIHQRNMQVSMTEIYEIVNGVASPIMNSQLWTVNYGTETITCRAPSLWGKLPCEFKLAPSLEEFKVKLFVFYN